MFLVSEIPHFEDICLDFRTFAAEVWCLSLWLKTFRNPVRKEKYRAGYRQWKCLYVSDIPHSLFAGEMYFFVQLLKISSQNSG